MVTRLAKWCLGRTLTYLDNFSLNLIIAVSCTASLLEDSVEKAQSIRHAAKKAILELQDDKSMCRALAARPRLARNFRPEDIVAYWRDQKWNQGKLSRGRRWYGSAVVIGLNGKNGHCSPDPYP